jgi:hypothetical protein
MTDPEGKEFATRILAAIASSAGIEDTVPPRTFAEWESFADEHEMMFHMNNDLDKFALSARCTPEDHPPTLGWVCRPAYRGGASVDTVTIFRRADMSTKDARFARLFAKDVFDFDFHPTRGPDFAMVTMIGGDGRKVTMLCEDVAYAEMINAWSDSTEVDPDFPEDRAELDKSKFHSPVPGWPEDWPGSGLERFER